MIRHPRFSTERRAVRRCVLALSRDDRGDAYVTAQLRLIYGTVPRVHAYALAFYGALATGLPMEQLPLLSSA
jgi:hypothetical protein